MAFGNFAQGMSRVAGDISAGQQQLTQQQYLQQQLQNQQSQQELDKIRLQILQSQQAEEQRKFEMQKQIWDQLVGSSTGGGQANVPAPAPSTGPYPYYHGQAPLYNVAPAGQAGAVGQGGVGGGGGLLNPMAAALVGIPSEAYKWYLQDQAAKGNPLAQQELDRLLTPEQREAQSKWQAYLKANDNDPVKAARAQEADKQRPEPPIRLQNVMITGAKEPHDVIEDPKGTVQIGGRTFADAGPSGEAFTQEQIAARSDKTAAEADARAAARAADQQAAQERLFAQQNALEDKREAAAEQRQHEREIQDDIDRKRTNVNSKAAAYRTAKEAEPKAGFWGGGAARQATAIALREYHLASQDLIVALDTAGRPIDPALTQEPAINTAWWNAYQQEMANRKQQPLAGGETVNVGSIKGLPSDQTGTGANGKQPAQPPGVVVYGPDGKIVGGAQNQPSTVKLSPAEIQAFPSQAGTVMDIGAAPAGSLWEKIATTDKGQIWGVKNGKWTLLGSVSK